MAKEGTGKGQTTLTQAWGTSESHRLWVEGWSCPACGRHNFPDRLECHQCALERPDLWKVLSTTFDDAYLGPNATKGKGKGEAVQEDEDPRDDVQQAAEAPLNEPKEVEKNPIVEEEEASLDEP